LFECIRGTRIPILVTRIHPREEIQTGRRNDDFGFSTLDFQWEGDQGIQVKPTGRRHDDFGFSTLDFWEGPMEEELFSDFFVKLKIKN
jgi:hypothetical protein